MCWRAATTVGGAQKGKGEKMNGKMTSTSTRRVLAAAVGAFIALAATSPAAAIKLVEFTIETDKEVYQLGETGRITWYAYNAGDEAVQIVYDCHYRVAEVRLYENAAGLSRDELLALQTHLRPYYQYGDCDYETWPYYILSPGETLTLS